VFAVAASTATWQKLELRCAITRERLTNPANGDSCLHLPSCNYEALREYVARARRYPVFGCQAMLRPKAVQSEQALREEIASLPPFAEAAWMCAGTGALRLESPVMPQPSRPSIQALDEDEGVEAEEEDEEEAITSGPHLRKRGRMLDAWQRQQAWDEMQRRPQMLHVTAGRMQAGSGAAR